MKTVPFYANTPDETHCLQASLRMILKYFWPEKEYTWEELEKISAKKEGLWTWPMATMLWLRQQGFEARNVEMFSYAEFAAKGTDYLVDMVGEKVAKEQVDHSDIKHEIQYAQRLANLDITEQRIPTLSEIKQRLDEGYLVICTVNYRTLNDLPDYSGHSVLVIDHTDNELIIHDPGLPGRANRHVSNELFEKAWAYPNEQAKNYIAVRLPGYDGTLTVANDRSEITSVETKS